MSSSLLTRCLVASRADLGGLMQQIAARYRVDAQAARRLMRLYGSEVFDRARRPADANHGRGFCRGNHLGGRRRSSALSLEDVVYRRLRIPWFRPEETAAVAAAAASICWPQTSWSPAARRDRR